MLGGVKSAIFTRVGVAIYVDGSLISFLINFGE